MKDMKCRFEIVGLSGIDGVPMHLKVNGKSKYQRLLIKKVKEEDIKEADIVVTNPPFSLFREYVALLMEYGKKFLIIGNMNAITYKEIFPLIKENKLWLGVSITSGDRRFDVPNDYPLEAATCGIDENGTRFIRVKGVRWFTNLDHQKRHEPIDLYKKYNADEFPHYDNYDAINVDKVCEIPMDYDGVMGVPITFLDKYCPTQFEIIGIANSARWIGSFPCFTIIDGKKIYNRILIKKVKEEDIKEADIVVTNPPFSLFREYVALLMQYNKKFLIIGNGNAVTYKEIFPLIKENKMWLGAGKGMGGKAVEFMVEESIYDASKGSVNRIENGICYVGVMMVTWFTNLDHYKRHQEIDLYKHYNEEEYPHYDNYDAIEVGRVSEIPMDYDGVIGVPISFLDKYCPTQFEIKGLDRYVEDNPRYGHRFHLNGKETYARILIRKLA